MHTPFFSVIVVCRNAGEKLHQTIDSVLSQTEGDFEILVKDAGSTDGSLQSLPSDERIRVTVSKDQGIYDGMNIAAGLATGRILYFLNCGDLLHDETVLSKVRAAVEADSLPGSAIYYGDIIEETTGQRVVANPVMSHFAMYRNIPNHQACFYTAEIFKGEKFDLTWKVRADYEHFLRVVITKNVRTVPMGFVVADYEGGGYSESEEGRRRSAEEHKEITGKYFTLRERFCFKAYLILTLQPLREKLAHGKHTAALYDRVRNGLLQRGGRA